MPADDVPDRVTGNILRVDPKSPKPVVVGRIEAREVSGKKINADASGLAFNSQGDLFIGVGPFSEVVRVRDCVPQVLGQLLGIDDDLVIVHTDDGIRSERGVAD